MPKTGGDGFGSDDISGLARDKHQTVIEGIRDRGNIKALAARAAKVIKLTEVLKRAKALYGYKPGGPGAWLGVTRNMQKLGISNY